MLLLATRPRELPRPSPRGSYSDSYFCSCSPPALANCLGRALGAALLQRGTAQEQRGTSQQQRGRAQKQLQTILRLCVKVRGSELSLKEILFERLLLRKLVTGSIPGGALQQREEQRREGDGKTERRYVFAATQPGFPCESQPTSQLSLSSPGSSASAASPASPASPGHGPNGCPSHKHAGGKQLLLRKPCQTL